jgi:hypothetical protein
MARGQKLPLREELRDLLLEIVRDRAAPATARASAARTLFDMEEQGAGDGGPRANEMTAEEIDAELASSPQKAR